MRLVPSLIASAVTIATAIGILNFASAPLHAASTATAAPIASLADFGAQPGPEHDSAPAFAKAIEWLAQNPGGTLMIPEGAFHIKTNPPATLVSGNKSEAHLNFDRLKNITLAGQGRGSEIVLGQFALGLLFENCDGLTLRNLTFDYAFPLFSQGEVLEISDQDNSLLLKPDPGYPSPVTQPGTLFRHPASTWLTLNRQGMNLAFPEALNTLKAPPTHLNEDGTVRFFYRNQKNVARRLRGDGPLRYVRVARYAGQLIRLRNCNDVRLEGLTIYAASGFTILGSMCRDVIVRDCVFEPRPGTDRAISTCADGLHFVGGQGKYLIERNTFDSLQDDNVNFILRGNTIDALPRPNVLRLTAGSVRHYAAGDNLRIYDLKNARHSDYTLTHVETESGGRFTLTLDRPVTESLVFASAIHDEPLTLVFNTSWSFGDVTIRDNKFLNNRARAVRLAGTGIVVENNTFDLSAFPAVLVHSVIRDGLKSAEDNAFAERVTIRNNTIRRALNNGGASGNPGAITVEILDAGANGAVADKLRFIRDITITGNRIIDSGRAGIGATNVNGLVIADNTIIDPNQLHGASPAARCGIYLRAVENERIENNTITGANIDRPIYRHPAPPPAPTPPPPPPPPHPQAQ
ncbi:right-handed parallel beta-helix repeat-containing protein [Geminisphaera colitermitum]|uniref:right-handed parallel beta-helix repeat-containing protein n=1 Tax=Geminisphaera colitermitum TaxID=1148786 RepID=UPI000158C99D|nr:right-handed parallel beta-helix repeat-containing protein [Geminisphaera colitermitum]